MPRGIESRICAMTLAVLLACCVAHEARASSDTGTYTILDYTVKLTPKSDGSVEVNYYQKWLVTSGHIPWITVGTPNSGFQILQDKNSGNVRSVGSASGGSWSGVRIDLDKDYRPNETFEVGFTIAQNGLFYAKKDIYRLEFTPGWYDRAETRRLRVEVFFFAKLDTVSASPKPTRIEGRSMIWEKAGLGKGERFRISVSFPKNLFPTPLSKKALQSKGGGLAGVVIVLLLLGGFLALFVIIAVAAWRARGKYGGGGGIFYGGSGGTRSSSGSRSISAGGGGGFGGRSFSCACACACAGCACACACAGGGGAGCDRKLTHRCPLCANCERKNECPVWTGARAA